MMRFGLPVLGFDVGGVPEWLADKTGGYLLDPFDIAGMTQRLNQVMSSPHSARRLGQKAKEHAGVFPERRAFVGSVLGILEDAHAQRKEQSAPLSSPAEFSTPQPANENQRHKAHGALSQAVAGEKH
jgi:hypothetical protein